MEIGNIRDFINALEEEGYKIEPSNAELEGALGQAHSKLAAIQSILSGTVVGTSNAPDKPMEILVE